MPFGLLVSRGNIKLVSGVSQVRKILMDLLYQALPEMIATLIGVVVGGVGALYIDSRRELSNKKKRAGIILYNIFGELKDNFLALEKPDLLTKKPVSEKVFTSAPLPGKPRQPVVTCRISWALNWQILLKTSIQYCKISPTTST